MKLILSIILVCFFSNELLAQNPYYDALKLRALVDETGKIDGETEDYNNIILPIFEHYSYDRDAGKNPFLDPFRDEGSGASLLNISSYNKLTSSVGGVPVTTFADGLAQFMIERANEEINVWFFRKFKDDLDESVELRTMFPLTNVFVQITEPYQYAQNLHLLREAFKKDLAEILDNLEKLAALEKYKRLFAPPSSLKIIPIGLAGASIVSKIKNGTHPAEVIDSLGRKEYLNGTNNDLYSGLRVLSVLSQSVRSEDPNTAYVTPALFKEKILDDPIAFRIYLGLLYQEMEGIIFQTGQSTITVQDFLKNNKDEIITSKNIGLGLFEKLKILEDNFQDLKSRNNTTEIKYIEWYNFYDSALDVVEFGIDGSNSLGIKVLNKTLEYNRFMFSARQGNEIFKNVYEKNYSLSVLNFSVLYDSVVYKPQLVNGTNDFPPSSKFIKYGAFMAAVADAEKPEDVKAALNAAALPAGSSSIKRQTPFNVSINSYLGFHWGDEKLDGIGWGRIRGVSAPVGIAFSTDTNWPFRESGSLSFFGSIIDIGAVASFRLTNDEGVETLPELKLENIIAPGAYLVYGFPKAPISIGYGWQRGPQLRGITTTSNVEGEPPVVNFDLANGYRWNFFIAVDIPLFNLYTKSK